jgi:hypothetical protein
MAVPMVYKLVVLMDNSMVVGKDTSSVGLTVKLLVLLKADTKAAMLASYSADLMVDLRVALMV